jgi:YHS domain-containing protein
MSISRLPLYSLLFALALVVAGCKPQGEKDQNQATPSNNVAAKEATADSASSEISKNLAELSVEDRDLAQKQRICPVSGELLGSMAKPYKTSVQGKTVFLCCEGCEKELKDNPDKYLEKLKTP